MSNSIQIIFLFNLRNAMVLTSYQDFKNPRFETSVQRVRSLPRNVLESILT